MCSSDLLTASSVFDSAYVNGGATNRYNGDLFASPSIDNPVILRINSSSLNSLATSEGINIGNDRNYASYNRGWKGLIGEYIIFSSQLNTIDRNSLQTHLSAKWGITLF